MAPLCGPLALVLFGIFGFMVVSASDISIEDRVASMEQKLTQMTEKFSLLENTVASVEKKSLTERDELFLKTNHLESRLSDLTAKVTDYDKLIAEVSNRMKDMESRYLKIERHFMLQVDQLNAAYSETNKMIQKVKQDVTGELEREQLKTIILQDKLSETQHLLKSFLSAHSVTVSPEDHLRMGVDGIQKLGFDDIHSNLTEKLGHIEQSISKFEKDCVGDGSMSRLNDSLQYVDRALGTMNHTLRQHTYQLSLLNGQLDSLSCTGEPPSVEYGKPVDLDRRPGAVVKYQCDKSFVPIGNSTVYCKSGNWEGEAARCTFFDTSFVLVANRHDNVSCYSDESYKKIEFSRVIDTGLGGALPSNVNISTRRNRAVMKFPRTTSKENFGVFQCQYSDKHGSMAAVAVFKYPGGLDFKNTSIVANIGDTVELEVIKTLKSRSRSKWLHNGAPIPPWNDQLKVVIQDVQMADAGIYEYYLTSGRTLFQVFARLIVRKCKANLYGELCNQKCPPCYNGGVCHDVRGICICPAGFSGHNCEVACEEGHFGVDCSEICPQSNCQHLTFCKPDPYGCSCAPGYKGNKCAERCESGWYGADCTQPCNCAEGPSACNGATGACSGGCLSGWTGQSCQIEVPG